MVTKGGGDEVSAYRRNLSSSLKVLYPKTQTSSGVGDKVRVVKVVVLLEDERRTRQGDP